MRSTALAVVRRGVRRLYSSRVEGVVVDSRLEEHHNWTGVKKWSQLYTVEQADGKWARCERILTPEEKDTEKELEPAGSSVLFDVVAGGLLPSQIQPQGTKPRGRDTLMGALVHWELQSQGGVEFWGSDGVAYLRQVCWVKTPSGEVERVTRWVTREHADTPPPTGPEGAVRWDIFRWYGACWLAGEEEPILVRGEVEAVSRRVGKGVDYDLYTIVNAKGEKLHIRRSNPQSEGPRCHVGEKVTLLVLSVRGALYYRGSRQRGARMLRGVISSFRRVGLVRLPHGPVSMLERYTMKTEQGAETLFTRFAGESDTPVGAVGDRVAVVVRDCAKGIPGLVCVLNPNMSDLIASAVAEAANNEEEEEEGGPGAELFRKANNQSGQWFDSANTESNQ
eukprot:Hpha_TRINITY_DN1865_c0_g1::TRINITY_DN1865_c0_g1_i1::g.170680::m.170680